jgi:hypothetical protein
MVDDPLMPAFRRFPRDQWPAPGSDEPPSSVRPFVLRGAKVGGAYEPGAREAKHRTPKSQTPHETPTTSDGKDGPKTVPDVHYTPDD